MPLDHPPFFPCCFHECIAIPRAVFYYFFLQADEDKDQDEEGVLGRPSIWVGTHTIYYRACTGDIGESSTSASKSTGYTTTLKSTKKSQGKRNRDLLGGESNFIMGNLYFYCYTD
jgi:hypothetical protein